jgi:hypothetical protein
MASVAFMGWVHRSAFALETMGCGFWIETGQTLPAGKTGFPREAFI